jgi:hypothetical protein
VDGGERGREGKRLVTSFTSGQHRFDLFRGKRLFFTVKTADCF